MKKLALLASCFAFAIASATAIDAVELKQDLTSEIPSISLPEVEGFQKIDNVAQYKEADWSQVVGIARHISLREAQMIAKENPEISFFFYTKGGQMVLETQDGGYRVFRHGDAVFFSGKPWWGSAPGLADGYVKTN
jgi:queuine/archaeosine tRNA-ribosyltransferase